MFQKNVAGQHVHIEAFDAATGLQKTGDSANITIYYQQGNLSSALGTVTALADTTINESSSSNAKGTYWGNLSQGETNCDELNITAKSATGNITITARRYNTVAPNMNKVSVDSNGRLDVIKLAGTTQTAKDVGAALPAAAPGAANGLLIAGTNAAVALLNFTGNMTGNVSGSLGSLTTNNDKTGYRLSATGVDDIWDEPMSGHSTSFTAGDELQQSFTQIFTYLDAAISGLPTAVQNADTLLDRNMATGADNGSATVRTVRQALRVLRNKVDLATTPGTMDVKKEDDSASSWTATLTTDGTAEPITVIDPSGP